MQYVQFKKCSKCESMNVELFVNLWGNREGVRCKNCGHEISKEIREAKPTPTYHKSSRVDIF